MPVTHNPGPSPASSGASEAPDPHRALPPAALGEGPGEVPIHDPAHLLPEHATGGPEKRHSWLRIVILVLILLGIAALVVWRIHSSHQAAAQEAARTAAAANRPTPVQVLPVQQKTVPVFLTALGTVTPYNTVTLHSRVDGQLLQVNFREGQFVHKGDLLLQIDPRPYQATVDQAVGTLAKDEANLHNMQAEAQRYTALYQAGVVSKEQQQLEVSNQGQAAGTIKSDQAAIEAAKVNLGYTRIYSPINGIVGLRQVDPGNIVHAADTTGLVVITQVHPIAIIFTLPEEQLSQVETAMHSGHPLVVQAYDRGDAHLIASGTLLTIDNQIDTTTGTAKLKAVFDNGDNSLFPNQFVNVRLILRERQNATVVPSAAIESGTQGDYVFVVNPGPTPANKRQSQGNGGAPAGGNATVAGTTATSGTGVSGGTAPTAESPAVPAVAGQPATGTGRRGQSRAQYHADMVPVHVDFTIGTSSVLTNGELKPGQQLVVDGQEKLVDGGNVSPQTARSPISTGGANSSVGAGAGAPSAAPGAPAGGSTGSAPGQANRSNATNGGSQQ